MLRTTSRAPPRGPRPRACLATRHPDRSATLACLLHARRRLSWVPRPVKQNHVRCVGCTRGVSGRPSRGTVGLVAPRCGRWVPPRTLPVVRRMLVVRVADRVPAPLPVKAGTLLSSQTLLPSPSSCCGCCRRRSWCQRRLCRCLDAPCSLDDTRALSGGTRRAARAPRERPRRARAPSRPRRSRTARARRGWSRRPSRTRATPSAPLRA